MTTDNHDVHQPDEFCQPCIDQGYHAGLEAAIENITNTINKRELSMVLAADHIAETRDIVLDSFGSKFFEVNNLRLEVK